MITNHDSDEGEGSGYKKPSNPALLPCRPAEVGRGKGGAELKRSRPGKKRKFGKRHRISPEAVALAFERFERHTKHCLSRVLKKELFRALQYLLHCDPEKGAMLTQTRFSSEEVGRVIQEGLVNAGLATCLDWDSWKPTGFDLSKAKGRSFLPCDDLLSADTGSRVISSLGGRPRARVPRSANSVAVRLFPATGVDIGHTVTAALQKGTGLRVTFGAAREILSQLPGAERTGKLLGFLGASGRAEVEELRPNWEQKECGRVYCSRPAAINMPKVFLPALRSIHGLPLWEVDFSSFELRIACHLFNQPLPETDAYQPLADAAGISRKRVKEVVNPMLHGQTLNQVLFNRELTREAKEDRKLIEPQIKRLLPNLFKELGCLRKDKTHRLQRKGAQIFYACMNASMEQCGIESAGLPKHDGWVFASKPAQAETVSGIFRSVAEGMSGVHFPVTIKPVTLSNQ